MEYKSMQNICVSVFTKKLHTYGPTWRIMRPISILDQILIKVLRIRKLETTKTFAVHDECNGGVDLSKSPQNALYQEIYHEYVGVVNYANMFISQMGKDVLDKMPDNLDAAILLKDHSNILDAAEILMISKNEDYGDAWKVIECDSITDLILSKLYRIKEMITNPDFDPSISEGAISNAYDILNYGIFSMIKITKKEQP